MQLSIGIASIFVCVKKLRLIESTLGLLAKDKQQQQYTAAGLLNVFLLDIVPNIRIVYLTKENIHNHGGGEAALFFLCFWTLTSGGESSGQKRHNFRAKRAQL